MQVTIRQATLNDSVLLARLNYSVHDIHVVHMPQRYKVTTPDSPDVMADFERRVQDEQGRTYIAEVAGEAVGYICCQIREVAENPYVLRRKNVHIDQVGVEPAYRGQGVGSALLDCAMGLAQEQDADVLSLGVAAFNEGARRLYERHGFKVDSLRMAKQVMPRSDG